METLNGQPPRCDPPDAGLVEAVLQELAVLLGALAGDEQYSDAVDLHSLPLDDDARERLRQRLGRGPMPTGTPCSNRSSWHACRRCCWPTATTLPRRRSGSAPN